MHFCERKFLYVDLNVTENCSQATNDNNSALVQNGTDDKPLGLAWNRWQANDISLP